MESILSKIKKYPIIPVYYNDDVKSCLKVLKECYDGGIRIFEFVNRGAKAKKNFEILRSYKEENLPGLALGIGTIKNKEQALEYIQIGADFIVSPILRMEIAEVCKKHSVLWIPGCMTTTEIAQAEELELPLVKLFPADVLGPNFLKTIYPVFPNLKFMPTGGVEPTKESISSWRKAGVFAIGIGSKLFAKSDEDNITLRCKKCLLWAQIDE